MGLFPAYIENNVLSQNQKGRKLPREYEIDYKTGQLTGRIVEGREAVKAWIWLVLQIPRYRYYAYTWDYGNELEDLIGQGYSEEYIRAESQRMIEDCLLVNENIQSITEFDVNMVNDTLTVSFAVNTLYGSIEIKNQAIV